LYTGDLCRLDRDGYLYFISRMDEVIKSRGEKIAPLEVETVLAQIPGVIEAAVVGVPDRISGVALRAFLVTEPGARPSEQQIRSACASRLESFKVPTVFTFVDALPKTANGKIARARLVAGEQEAA
jgi:acyl-coenzyme A synthetase/AMP-(fatty) acid ligase